MEICPQRSGRPRTPRREEEGRLRRRGRDGRWGRRSRLFISPRWAWRRKNTVFILSGRDDSSAGREPAYPPGDSPARRQPQESVHPADWACAGTAEDPTPQRGRLVAATRRARRAAWRFVTSDQARSTWSAIDNGDGECGISAAVRHVFWRGRPPPPGRPAPAPIHAVVIPPRRSGTLGTLTSRSSSTRRRNGAYLSTGVWREEVPLCVDDASRKDGGPMTPGAGRHDSWA